jgi:hypothetical protein
VSSSTAHCVETTPRTFARRFSGDDKHLFAFLFKIIEDNAARTTGFGGGDVNSEALDIASQGEAS